VIGGELFERLWGQPVTLATSSVTVAA